MSLYQKIDSRLRANWWKVAIAILSWIATTVLCLLLNKIGEHHLFYAYCAMQGLFVAMVFIATLTWTLRKGNP